MRKLKLQQKAELIGASLKGMCENKKVYGTETWATRKAAENVLRNAERAMVRVMSSKWLTERKNSVHLLSMNAWSEVIVAMVM